MSDFVVGANEADAHLVGVNLERDFTPTACGDYRTAAAGDACARCDNGHLKPYRGIEVGQVFFLGTKYSKPMGVTFLDAEGKDVGQQVYYRSIQHDGTTPRTDRRTGRPAYRMSASSSPRTTTDHGP